MIDNQVVYWIKQNNKVIKLIEPCFSSIRCQKNKFIKYHVYINNSISNQIVFYYIKFLSKILDKKKFQYKLYKKLNKRLLSLKLKFTSSHKPLELLYLTAFRYLYEFPEIVKELYNLRKNNIKENFILFQELHMHHYLGTEKYNMNHNISCNLGGHGLIYNPSDWIANSSFISVIQFKNNLKQNKSSVQRYFRV